jgi:hypothetical protein
VTAAKLRKNSVGTVKIVLSAAERAAQVVDRASEPNALEIRTFENGNLEDLPFDLVLAC